MTTLINNNNAAGGGDLETRSPIRIIKFFVILFKVAAPGFYFFKDRPHISPGPPPPVVAPTPGVSETTLFTMSPKNNTDLRNPGVLSYIFISLGAMYTVCFAIGTLAGGFLPPAADGVARIGRSVMRNFFIATAAALKAFVSEGSSAAVVAAAYNIQVRSAEWYAKFTHIIFGSEEKDRHSSALKPATNRMMSSLLLASPVKPHLFTGDRHSVR